ncbi:UDP-N-acetylmuramate--L-alanine ligase [Candidatus Kaiserbacteria bacterium]|nr:UDP-N-acetylmuramate--L-alanine ligase [Candidatus Kaiserbacteria bacterium]
MELPEKIYMVGIGGIGMSALAQLLVSKGKDVSGSDRSESPTTELLAKKGIKVTFGHGNIPDGTELLIYSDAVWGDNPERKEAKEKGIPQISYFEALGEVSKGMRTIAVAGTHGKTTTTGMLTKILVDAGAKPTAIIGSIVKDFKSNFVAGNSDLFIVEACEYKDHLLKLSPEILVITNVEYDHTDFFPSLKEVQETFRKAAEAVSANGYIVCNPSDANLLPVLSAKGGSASGGKNIKAKIVDYTQKAVGNLQLAGEFNRENARAALAAALAIMPDLSPEAAVKSLSQFQGSWRRFEFKGETSGGALVYDDYAHHPTAVKKTIEMAHEKFPGKKIIVAFHPHLFSRTRDLMDGFAESLATADEVILAPIFAAREEPIEGVTSDVLAGKISFLGTPVKAFASLHEIYLHLTRSSKLEASTLLITMGAGDIYKVAEQITEE